MDFSVLSGGTLLFFGSMCLHIIIWRWRNPEKYLLALLAVFLIIPGAFVGLLVYIGQHGIVHNPGSSSLTALDILSVFFFHLSLVSAYILTYPAAQASCPSLSMLLVISASMPLGSTYEELKSSFNIEGLLQPRLRDLVTSRFVEESDGRFSITKRGVFVLSFFIFIRRILGLPPGKG
jgi:hypothetical protein